MPNNTPDIEQRLQDLKERAAKLTGGELFCWTSDDAPPEVVEQFLKNVLAYEEAKEVQPWDILVEGGMELPEAEEMDEDTLYKKLWELIYAMRLYGLYIEGTDHLSDRELYVRLWKDCLRRPMVIPMSDGGPVGHWHIDLREDGDVPEEDGDHKNPLCDRDRLLPRAY